ncbi:hypothetical protein BH10BAC3_BH10BAC3_01860 [soil metagenome]
MIKVVWHCRNNNLKEALKNYQLVAEINLLNWVILPVQEMMLDFTEKHFLELKEEMENEDNEEFN